MIKNLLIIGNGFDLQCGLKSSYKDFYEYRYRNNKPMDTKLGITISVSSPNNFRKCFFDADNGVEPFNKFKESMNYNVWDMFFYHKYEKVNSDSILWMDFEKDIFEFLTNNYRRLMDHEKLNYFPSQDTGMTWEEILPLKKYLEGKYSREDGFRSSADLIEILKIELNLFERSFAEYLKSIGGAKHLIQDLTIPNSYPDIAYGLLSSICKEVEIETSNLRILSFNYTNPFYQQPLGDNATADDVMKRISMPALTNIHGKLFQGISNKDKDNIIFGFDLSELDEEKCEEKDKNIIGRLKKADAILLSKTYRKIENATSDNTILDLEGTKNIIFYGHSLGKADYSYFQAIFDSVDLYHKKTKLTFLWSTYKGKEKVDIESGQVRAVVHLLQIYGDTFENKDHGKNLIDKLVLENRLSIRELVNVS
jgi:hypothetical protein